MANYDDYQLDEMENSAVNKSKNLKRGLVAGAAVLGVGGTAAYGANHYMNMNNDEESELTADDLLAGANAGVADTPEEAAPAAQSSQPAQQEVHVHHHIVEDPVTQQPGQVQQDSNVTVEETSVLFDENGEVVSVYDSGTIDGKAFVTIDSDLNGKADILAIDENSNGQFEDNEIHQIDNSTYEMGQGKTIAGYVKDSEGNVTKFFEEPNQVQYADNHGGGEDNPHEQIHNDFEDERTGESYHGDLADNNPDYNNRGGEQYSASHSQNESSEEYVITDDSNATYENQIDGMPDPSYAQNELMEPSYDEVETTESYETETYAQNDSYGEQEDYGYTEPADDLAFDNSGDAYDGGDFVDA